MGDHAPAPSSLVKYDTPILVSTTKTGTRKPGKAAASSGGSSPATGEILNSILPPREWTDDGQLWVQYVSSTPATRLDVIQLQERLDQKLQERQARETGICPIREELYTQCFDEIIRQVTINCAERGILLLRVRDEIRTTMHAYQTLYESSIAFGMRKALTAEQQKSEVQAKIKTLERENAELEAEIRGLQEKCTEIELREASRREADEKKHAEDVAHYKAANEAHQAKLEEILCIPSK
jgi:dynein light intermediate chain